MNYTDAIVIDALKREQKRLGVKLEDPKDGLRAKVRRLQAQTKSAEDELRSTLVKLNAVVNKLRAIHRA